jgi:hypothetical protein
MADPTEDAISDPWFRTASPERAIYLCSTAFYPHRLTLLGRSNCFGLTQRVTHILEYQTHTTRTFPLIVLNPAEDAAPRGDRVASQALGAESGDGFVDSKG